jgi:hypothetical protein
VGGDELMALLWDCGKTGRRLTTSEAGVKHCKSDIQFSN